MLSLGICLLLANSAGQLELLPAQVELTGSAATQQLRAYERQGNAIVADRTAQVKFSSSNPAVASVSDEGVVSVRGNGTATILAIQGDRRAASEVRVSQAEATIAWSYRNHVLPVLTKASCNSGARHGALAGKGGLKLSLRGYDPETDHYVLTEQALGRRVDRQQPDESLLLLKPVRALPHAGGKKFETDSEEYRRLRDWIAAGAYGPRPGSPTLARIEVLPAGLRLQPKDTARLIVRGWYSDGHAEDVTRWAKFSSSEDAVATTDDDGNIAVAGTGEAAINVWYSNFVASATITVPRSDPTYGNPFPQRTADQFIDAHVDRKLADLRIPPSPACDDATFIRRAYLDAAGCLPTPEEVQAFLADRSADKRAKLIDQLLQRPEYVDNWSHQWGDLFLVSSRKLTTPAMWAFHQHLRQTVADNVPWDRFARELLTAQGSNLQRGAANYFVIHKDVADLTETTAVTFLGTSITCARCHNHPLEKWTQDQYWQMANLFSRVGLKNGDKPNEIFVQAQPAGDVAHPRRGVPMPPAPLDGKALALDDPRDRRAAFADWLTAPDNPHFAKAICNRIWKNFFGRGLVDAEDDLRQTNPASHPELFDALAKDYASHGYDNRRLIRQIMNSAAYQRSSVANGANAGDTKYYSHYPIRRLPAEVILDAYSQVTGVETPFDSIRAGGRGATQAPTALFPLGTRAQQLPDAQVVSAFLDAFGRAERQQTCSCEKRADASVGQALHLNNGATLNDKLRASNSIVNRWLAAKTGDADAVRELYLRALSREPSAKELERSLAALADAPKSADARRELLEDLCWGVFTSKEFAFNR